MLSIEDDYKIKDLELKNPYSLSNYRNGEYNILDIKAVDENGVWYDTWDADLGTEFLWKASFILLVKSIFRANW